MFFSNYEYNPVEALALFVRAHITCMMKERFVDYYNISRRQTAFINALEPLSEEKAYLSACAQFKDIVNQVKEGDGVSLEKAFAVATYHVAWMSNVEVFGDKISSNCPWTQDQKAIMDIDIKESSFEPKVLALVHSWIKEDELPAMPDVIATNYICFGL